MYTYRTQREPFLFLAAAISGRRSGPPNYYPVSNLSPWARQTLGSDFGILEDRIDPESCRTNIPAILMPCCLVKKQPPFFLGVAKAFLMTGDSRVIYLFFYIIKMWIYKYTLLYMCDARSNKNQKILYRYITIWCDSGSLKRWDQLLDPSRRMFI